MSLGTNRPTASLESAIDFATSQGVIIVASAGNRGLTGWAGQVHFLKSFPPVRPAEPRNGPSRLGIGSSRMSSMGNADESFVANFSSRELQASSSISLRRASQCSVLGLPLPRSFAHFPREVISDSAALASPRLKGTAGRRGGLYLLNGGRLQQI